MWKGVTVIAKPTKTPVTLEDVKLWARFDHSDDDENLRALIDSAVSKIDGPQGIGVAMMTQTWRKSMDCFPSTILLPGWPIKSIATISYLDVEGVVQSLAPADYSADFDCEPVHVVPAYGTSWPATRRMPGVVKIEYVVGETSASAVDSDLLDAIRLFIVMRDEARSGVTEKPASELPYAFTALLNKHRRGVVTA